MLKSVSVRNFALVDALDIDLAGGLTVITGESGAGKSILLDALTLVLGSRAQRSKIRPGAKSLEVCAEFDIGDRGDLHQIMTEQALPDGDAANSILVRRTANADGRSRAFVNGSPVTLSVVESLTQSLIDIHGQNEHRELHDRANQRRLLDEFGGDAALVNAVATAYDEFRERADELTSLEAKINADRERRELLTYQIGELEALGEAIGTFEALSKEHKRQTQAVDILTTIDTALTDLRDSVLPSTSRIGDALDRLDDESTHLDAARELTTGAVAHLDELIDALRHYQDQVPTDPAELERVEASLSALHEISRKHRVAPERLAQHLDELRQALGSMTADEEQLEPLQLALAEARQTFDAKADELTAARERSAAPFASEIAKVMNQLGLAGGAIEVTFEPQESRYGKEAVEFLVTTNPNYPAGRLGDIASGGESARISLAVQVVAAERSALPCLILDEADVGVGGTTADVLGRLLRRLAETTQVIVITHAPQMAALGQTHLKVVKTSEQDTMIEALGSDARVEELARMLGGRAITNETRTFARTLLDEASAE